MSKTVILNGKRSPIGMKNGKLIGMRPDDLASNVLKSLVEDISYEGADEYRTKLETIKESYFGQGASKAAPASTENVDTLNTDNGNTVTDMSDSMSRYTAAISRGKSRDIYNN